MTKFTLSISIPLPNKSVATKSLELLALKLS